MGTPMDGKPQGLCDVEMVEVLGPTCCELHGTVAKAVPPTELSVQVPEAPGDGGWMVDGCWWMLVDGGWLGPKPWGVSIVSGERSNSWMVKKIWKIPSYKWMYMGVLCFFFVFRVFMVS